MTGPGLTNPEGDREGLQATFIWLIGAESPEVIADLVENGRDDLTAWATRWRINAPWIVDHGALVLKDIRRWPEADAVDLWQTTCEGPGWLPPALGFRVLWDPYLPSEGEPMGRVTGTKAEAKTQIYAAVDRYLDEVERRAAVAGFKPSKRRDGGGNVPTSERLRWLVRHTAGGESWGTIADRAGARRSTVSRLSKEMAEALPL